MTTRKYSSRSQQTTLTSAVTSGAVVLPVVSATTLLGGATVSTGQTFTVVIDPDTALEEIVEITVVNGNNLNVNRAVDMAGAAAQDHSSGAVVRHMIIGRDLRESNTHIEASAAYNDGTGTHALHGLGSSDGSVVGTDATQTLTNKTLIAPTLTGLFENDASITFEGATADAFETTLTVVDPTQDNTITLPNTTGTVVIATATQTLTNKTLTSPTISGSPVITGLSSAGMSASSAAPKDYVDAVLVLQTAQATAAATSAASAATSATAAATSATSAAASATAAATSATSAAASATTASASVASIATYASNALASQNAASTSATSAAASATAAATSATSAAASATTASNSASTATTQAAAASTSATSAAASATAAATSATSAAASVSAVATSAASALTSQTAAATSATSAAASATAAATSASSAATSATSAATSASSSLVTYNTYKTYYLGSFASAPTLDNQGNALITGATYFNSTTNLMYAWSGSAWQAISTTSSYSAPTLGSTTIASGTTYANVTGLTINSTTIPTSKTLVVTTDKLSVHAATTSAELAGVISDETGSGALVFGTSPTLTTAVASADPTTALGLATKQYVDLVTAGVNYHAPVVAASVSNLSANYSNGSSGVGATLTADTNRAFSTLDGQTVSVGQRILIKDQTTQLQNGIYTLTTVGSGAAPWVITRATDNDAAPELANGDVINVTGGTVNSGKTFVNSTTGTITVGTTAITWASYYTGLPSQTGSTGLYLTTDGTTPSWSAVSALPSQTGNSGKYLTTNGSAASWATITTDPTPTVFMLGGM